MPTDGVPDNGGWRHPWPWFLWRGLGLFALGIGLAWVGNWLHAGWLQVVAFGLAVAAMWMHAIAFGEARRGRGAAWWRWYQRASDRNVRAAQQRSRPDSSEPPAA